MGLIDLKTDLKSLRYGNDQRGGGSSNQPYIVTPIPDGFAPTSPDFLLRNGYLNPLSSIQDVSRLTKLFFDLKSPNGLQFITKQILLERQNVIVPGGFNRIYNPLGTLAQAGVVSTGYRLNKQGLNPFARGYFNGGQEGYYRFTQAADNIDNGVDGGENRLALLYKIKQVGNAKPTDVILARGVYDISDNPNYLFSYSGGPGSVLGVGRTNIRVIGDGYGNPSERTNTYKLSNGSNYNETYVFDNQLVGTPPRVTSIGNRKILLSGLTDYRQTINNSLNSNVIPSTDYNRFNRDQTYRFDGESNARRLDPNLSYSNNFITLIPPTTRKLNVSLDGINQIDTAKQSDIIKFFIEVIDNNSNDIDNNVFLFFRAYLESINDNFKADWNSYKYVGRAENFYKYGGFSRDFSLTFKVVAESREEIIPIYQKLNYLASLTAPDYSIGYTIGKGLMKGNFVNMTIGDYLSDVPCIIQSISLKPIFEVGWDINREINGNPINGDKLDSEVNLYQGQLPKAIDVDMSIIPLHNFIPQLNKPYIGNNKHIIPNEVLKTAKTEAERESQLENQGFTLPEIEIVG